jgi:hypothetical protein
MSTKTMDTRKDTCAMSVRKLVNLKMDEIYKLIGENR